MHPELEKLLNIALKDGILTDKEKEILLNKAKKLKVDLDEFEMELEGVLSNLNSVNSQTSNEQVKSENSNANSPQNKKKGFFSFLRKRYSLEEAYLKGTKKLGKFGTELNNEVQPTLLKKYLHDDMTEKELDIAVLDAFNEIFGIFSATQAYMVAVELLKEKTFINPYKQESELKKFIKEGMTYEEIDQATENAYQKYFRLYDKTDALKLATAYIKRLGPIDGSLDFVQKSSDKVSKNEQLLMSYFTDNMTIEDVETACRTAYLNQFGKKSWGGLGSREMTNPDFSITELFSSETEE